MENILVVVCVIAKRTNTNNCENPSKYITQRIIGICAPCKANEFRFPIKTEPTSSSYSKNVLMIMMLWYFSDFVDFVNLLDFADFRIY